MAYNGEGVNALVCAVDDLEKSTLIYVDLRVRTILKCVAYYDEFKNVLAICNRGFDYAAEKSRALGQIGDTAVFRLPKDQKHVVALISGMLVEFDAGNMDVIGFAMTYFPAKTKQDSFLQFCAKVIEPFKRALVAFVWDGINDEPRVVERTVELAPSGLRQQTESYVVNLMKAVKDIAPDERGDLPVVIEGLAAALDSRDTLMIKSIWYGLRFMLKSRRLCEKEVEGIDEAIGMYLISL